MINLKLCVLVLAAMSIGANCASAKADIKTALDAAADACRAQAPQSFVAIVDPKSGAIAQIVCATAEEIDAVVAPILGAAKGEAIGAAATTCAPTASVAVVVDASGAITSKTCLSQVQAQTAAAAIADRRKAAAQ